jgi:hypothetical protein
MKKETARTLMIIVGLLVLLAVLGLGSALWLFTRSFEAGKADEQTALSEFARIRQRFAGVEPILGMREGDPVILRKPNRAAAPVGLSVLHVIHWDPDDEMFTRIDLPFWLLRLKSGPIEIGSDVGYQGQLDLTVEDLERFGPTVVLDHTDRGGDRVLIWTE